MVTPLTTPAADSSNTERPKIYDVSADGSQQITNALATARKEHKVVLLQFGANWCGWCHKLHKLFASDKAIHEELKANYVVVMIDVDKSHNKDLVAKYGTERLGLPCLVVLDANGKHLTTKNTGELEEGDHHSPEKVMAFLKSWAPKR
jgi:thiol:disulfide interchange protein